MQYSLSRIILASNTAAAGSTPTGRPLPRPEGRSAYYRSRSGAQLASVDAGVPTPLETALVADGDVS
jgi:hypothetical protein